MCQQCEVQNRRKEGIPSRMKAVVAFAPGDYRLQEVEVPSIGPGEILVKVEACGICAGDVKAWEARRASGAMTSSLPILRRQ